MPLKTIKDSTSLNCTSHLRMTGQFITIFLLDKNTFKIGRSRNKNNVAIYKTTEFPIHLQW